MKYFTVLDSTGKILWVSDIAHKMELTREQMHGSQCVSFINNPKPFSERCGAAIMLGHAVEFDAQMTDHSKQQDFKIIVEPIRETGHAQLVAIATPVVEHSLTDNELQIAKHVANDLTQKEIADQMGLTVSTIGSHCTKIRKKLGVRGVAGITRFIVESDLDD